MTVHSRQIQVEQNKVRARHLTGLAHAGEESQRLGAIPDHVELMRNLMLDQCPFHQQNVREVVLGQKNPQASTPGKEK
jgi:hypothetical protein